MPPYDPQNQFAVQQPVKPPEPSPWFKKVFTTENFLESALYGATGYKPNPQEEDNVLGLITGEVAGFIPFMRGAKALRAGIGVAKGASKASKVALKMMSNRKGRLALQNVGAKPTHSSWKAFKSFMGFELAYQGTKLATGGQLDEYETSPAELDQKLLLYPAVGGAVGATATKAMAWWAGRAATKAAGKWKAPVPEKEGKKAFDELVKNNQAVEKVRAQEAESLKWYGEIEEADRLLEGAGVQPAKRRLLDEGVIQENALSPNPQEAAKQSMRDLLPDAKNVSKDSWDELADEAVKPTAKETIRKKPPSTMQDMLTGGKAPEELSYVEASAARIGKAVDDSEAYKNIVKEKMFSKSNFRRRFWGTTSQWNAYVKGAAKKGEITPDDARTLQALRSQQLREVSTTSAKTEAVEKAIFADMLPEEERLLNVLIMSDGTIDASKRWLANEQAKNLGVFAQRTDAGELVNRSFIDEVATAVKDKRLAREDAGLLTKMVEDGKLDRATMSELNSKQRGFVNEFLQVKDLDTAGASLDDWINTKGLIETQYPHLAGKAKNYFDIIRKETLDPLREARLIDEATYQHLADDKYIRRRFLRIADETLLKGGDEESMLKALTNDQVIVDSKMGVEPMQRLRGGSQDVLDFDVKALTRYAVGSAERAIVKNDLARELQRVAKGGSNFARKPKKGERLPLNMGEMTVINPVDELTVGVDKFWVNKEILREMETAPVELSQMNVKMFSWMTGSKPLRAGATAYNPGFAAVNVMRDIMQSFMASTLRSSSAPKAAVQGIDDMRVTMKEAWKMKGDLTDFARRSGLQGPFHAGFGERSLQTFDDFVKHGGKGQHTGAFGKATKVMGKLSEFSEWWLRLANFRRALKNQATKEGVEVEDLVGNTNAGRMAAFEANRIIDFQDAGTTTRVLDIAYAPYLSAMQQGTRSVVRAAQEDPALFAWKTAQLGTLATVAYMTSKMVDPVGYKHVSDFRKENSFVFMTPFQKTLPSGEKLNYYMHFPKPDIPGFSLLWDGMLRYALDGEMPDGTFFDRLQKGVVAKAVPPTAQAAVAYFMNKDVWQQKDIWSPFRDVSAQFEYNENTSIAARQIGSVTGLSPARMEVAMGKVVSGANPWLNGIGFAWKGIADVVTENEVERDWFWNDLLDTFPMTGRFIDTTAPVSREIYTTIFEARQEHTDVRSQINGQFDKIHHGVVQGYQDWGDLMRFIKTQPPNERDRLVRKYRFLKTKPSGRNARILSAMSGMPSEARGRAAYRVYHKLPEAERSDFLNEMKRYPGFASSEMYRAFKDEDTATYGTPRGR